MCPLMISRKSCVWTTSIFSLPLPGGTSRFEDREFVRQGSGQCSFCRLETMEKKSEAFGSLVFRMGI